MSVTAIGPIESTVHVTNTWLKELMEELGWEDRQQGDHALRRGASRPARSVNRRRGGRLGGSATDADSRFVL